MLPRSVPIVRQPSEENEDADDDDDDDDRPPSRSFTQTEVLPQTTGGFGGATIMYASKIVREGVLPGGRNVNR